MEENKRGPRVDCSLCNNLIIEEENGSGCRPLLRVGGCDDTMLGYHTEAFASVTVFNRKGTTYSPRFFSDNTKLNPKTCNEESCTFAPEFQLTQFSGNPRERKRRRAIKIFEILNNHMNHHCVPGGRWFEKAMITWTLYQEEHDKASGPGSSTLKRKSIPLSDENVTKKMKPGRKRISQNRITKSKEEVHSRTIDDYVKSRTPWSEPQLEAVLVAQRELKWAIRAPPATPILRNAQLEGINNGITPFLTSNWLAHVNAQRSEARFDAPGPNDGDETKAHSRKDVITRTINNMLSSYAPPPSTPYTVMREMWQGEAYWLLSPTIRGPRL